MTISAAVETKNTMANFESATANINGVQIHYLLGGEKGLGGRVSEMLSLVAENVTQQVYPNSGHFLPEERPDEIVQQIIAITGKPQAKQAATAAASKISD